MTAEGIILDVYTKYGEYLEMIEEAEEKILAMNYLLCQVIIKERGELEFYKKAYRDSTSPRI